jgi:hypothetical protein
MNTPRTNAEVWIHDYMGKKFSVVGADFARQLETEVQELRAALEVAVVSHRNLYKATFGEKSDPHNDGVFTQMFAALAKVPK